jgi:hypothetical protein
MTRQVVSSGGPFEQINGYSRAVCVGAQGAYCWSRRQVRGQAIPMCRRRIFSATIRSMLKQAGARIDDVVRTVIYVTDINDADLVGRAHSDAGFHVFGRHVPSVAIDLAPRRPHDLAGSGATGEQRQFQRASRGLRPQLGKEAGQIPPRHRWSRLTMADKRGRSRRTLLQGLVPLNRPGSTAMACSMICSM